MFPAAVLLFKFNSNVAQRSPHSTMQYARPRYLRAYADAHPRFCSPCSTPRCGARALLLLLLILQLLRIAADRGLLCHISGVS
jgi:hypothetical protein